MTPIRICVNLVTGRSCVSGFILCAKTKTLNLLVFMFVSRLLVPLSFCRMNKNPHTQAPPICNRYGRCHTKRSPMAWVVIPPKEVWAGEIFVRCRPHEPEALYIQWYNAQSVPLIGQSVFWLIARFSLFSLGLNPCLNSRKLWILIGIWAIEITYHWYIYYVQM